MSPVPRMEGSGRNLGMAGQKRDALLTRAREDWWQEAPFAGRFATSQPAAECSAVTWTLRSPYTHESVDRLTV